MVILSVALTSQKGKILLARQYVPMTRLRIEGLLAAFPKLIVAEENASVKQHTFIETDQVRYIYQPIDTIYLLLITNMQSNILEDLATLRMIAKLIPQYCLGHNETSIQQHAFDLLFAIDEVVSPMGYREQVDEKQVEQFTTMDSAEEKLTQLIQDDKQQHQKEFLKKKGQEFDKMRAEKARLEKQQGKSSGIPGLPISLAGFGSGFGSDKKAISSDMKIFGDEPDVKIISHNTNNIGNDDNQNGDDNVIIKKKIGDRKRGFDVAQKNKKDDALFNEALEQDKQQLKTNLLPSTFGIASTSKNADTSDSAFKPVEINITEKLSLQYGRDGDLQKFEIKGDMEIAVNIPEATKCIIETTCNYNEKDSKFGRINWRLHPRMDNTLWNKGIGKLVLKEEDKAFKIGRADKTSILKWRMNANDVNDESIVPIFLEFWPENDKNKIQVSARYRIQENLDSPLLNVIISFRIPNNQQPSINHCDGNYNYSKHNHELQWILGNVNPNDEGTFDYHVSDCDVDQLWPVNIHFEMKTSYSQLQVKKVTNGQTSEEFDFSCQSMCVTDQCSIQNS